MSAKYGRHGNPDGEEDQGALEHDPSELDPDIEVSHTWTARMCLSSVASKMTCMGP